MDLNIAVLHISIHFFNYLGKYPKGNRPALLENGFPHMDSCQGVSITIAVELILEIIDQGGTVGVTAC